MVGSLIIKIGFAAILLSCIAYVSHLKYTSRSTLLAARTFYGIATGAIVASSVMMIYLIMTHQFQYSYVWNYSSTDLPGPLLFSSFYAGQEGSFSLWALYTALIGIILIRFNAKRGYEAAFMVPFTLMLAFLFGMLIAKNPFAFIWDLFPNELLHTGTIPDGVQNFVWIDQAKSIWAQYPAEGKGLNALLQNYWMVIHPPILFLGFTSMSIPFAYAIAGLIKKDFSGWIHPAGPWTIFGSLALGTGIVLGGYWAYETLGWGGYWGWDPVENSSLIPWLVCIASVHTMLSQRKNGGFIKTTFILSMLCYILVLYSTFLTRSGVLGDTSVHSFVEPGMWVYVLLLAFLFTFMSGGTILFFFRLKEIPKTISKHTFLSREFALTLGSLALVLVAIFVVIGTSAPLITGLLYNKPSAVDTNYYVMTSLPLGIIIAFLSGLGQIVWWNSSNRTATMENVKIPALVALLGTAGAFFIGAHHAAMLLMIYAALLALSINSQIAYKIILGNPKMAGGAIAHIGISLMLLGFVASAKYDEKITISLEEGRKVDALGYSMTYLGYHSLERERYAFSIQVEKGLEKYIVAPVMYLDKQNDNLIRNPDILNLLTKDFYVAPMSLDAAGEAKGKELTLHPYESKSIGVYTLTYLGYDFSSLEVEGNVLKANFILEDKGRNENLTAIMRNNKGNVEFLPALSNNNQLIVTIKSLNPNSSDKTLAAVTVVVQDHSKTSAGTTKDILVVEASIKPFINFVWLGTCTLIAGFLLTILRRSKEL